jgi:integrase
LIAIHHAHQKAGYVSPVMTSKVKAVMQGIRRTSGTTQRRVRALVKDDLIEALLLSDQQAPNKAARDRALLLVGFAGAFRRSELVGICVEHLDFVEAGVEVLLPRSKTDQEGQGRIVFIPYARSERCPVKALKDWLKVANIETGLVFRSISRHDHIGNRLTAQSVALTFKAAMVRVRAHEAGHYSGHSLRAGYVTQATIAGLPTFQIKEVTGHRSDATLAKYVRIAQRRTVPSLL